MFIDPRSSLRLSSFDGAGKISTFHSNLNSAPSNEA